jgi:hypothetical protein
MHTNDDRPDVPDDDDDAGPFKGPRRAPAAGTKHGHRHVCECGAELWCIPHDRCTVTREPWRCQACEEAADLQQRDAYFNALERKS